MFRLFSKSKITPKLEGPFGVLIGEQAIKYFGLTPVGSHEGIDEHSFNTLTVPKPHAMFPYYFGRFVDAYGKGQPLGLSRVRAHTHSMYENESSLMSEYGSFVQRVSNKYGSYSLSGTLVKSNEVPVLSEIKTISPEEWTKLKHQQYVRFYTSTWDLEERNKKQRDGITKINVSLIGQTTFDIQNKRRNLGIIEIEYIFENDARADDLYLESLLDRGESDDALL